MAGLAPAAALDLGSRVLGGQLGLGAVKARSAVYAPACGGRGFDFPSRGGRVAAGVGFNRRRI